MLNQTVLTGNLGADPEIFYSAEGNPVASFNFCNEDVWRKDSEGNKIRKGSYGPEGDVGWEIDLKKPVEKGGTANPRNVQPLHWKENREKSDKY